MSRITAPRPADHLWPYPARAPRTTLWPVWERICALVAAGIAQMRAHRQLRRAELELRQLDDRMLRDIGFTRSEIGSMVRHGRGGRTPIAKGVWL